MFSFPNPVNDKAARTVAGVVLATVAAAGARGGRSPGRGGQPALSFTSWLGRRRRAAMF